MPGDVVPPVVLDATVLSNFASSGAVGRLVRILDHPVTVHAVCQELERGRDLDYEFLDDALARLGDDVPVMTVEDEMVDGASGIRGRLDPGEAESLFGAIERGGTLATDDLAARRVARDREVPVTGSIGILVLGTRRNVVDVDTANDWLATWQEVRGYYAPVERIEEAME